MSHIKTLILDKSKVDLSNPEHSLCREIVKFWSKMKKEAPKALRAELKQQPDISLSKFLTLGNQEGYIFKLKNPSKDLKKHALSYIIVQNI